MPSRGFTLVEIVATLLLFMLGTLAAVAAITRALDTAARTQAEATAWITAQSILRDALPDGAETVGKSGDPTSLRLSAWIWSRSASTWEAKDGSGEVVWQYTELPNGGGGHVVSDMADPRCNNPVVFPVNGHPSPGCGRGWLNGYYVERREQSGASDQLTSTMRMIEVRVDVYWAGYGANDGRPLATAIDRYVRSDR